MQMIRALYVDDEEALLELCKEFLERSGDISVATSSSALSAEERLSSGEFDAVIADYQMPVRSGLDLLKSIRSRGSDMPFILFTGKGREEVVIEALNSGADFYLQKGGDPLAQFAELEHKVRTAVQRRTMEQELRKSEESYRAIFESASEEIALFDAETGHLVDANAATMRALGCSSLEEMRARKHTGSPPYSSEEALEHLRRAMNEGAHAFEWFIEDRNGHAVWQEVRLQRVRTKSRQCIMAMSRDITERKEREMALSSSEEKLRLALQAANEVTFELDMDTLEMVGGRRLFQMMGYPPYDGPANLDVLKDLVHPDDLILIAEWLEGDRSSVTHDMQIRVRAASGHYRWLGIKANLMEKAASGQGKRLMGTIRDITEKKLVEDAAIRNAEIVQALMDATSDMALLIDADTRLLAFNDAFVSALGTDKEELLGRTMLEVQDMRRGEAAGVVSALSHHRAAMLRSVITTGSGMSFLEDHEGRHLQHTLRPILGGDDKVERVAVFSRDVTDQLKGERSLVESEERFRSFMEQSSDGLLLTDEEGRIIEVNRSALAALGVDKGTVLGTTVWDLHYASLQPERRSMETYESLIQMYKGALQTGQGDFLSKLIDERFQLRGGRQYDLQVVFWTIRSRQGHRLAASIRDVTDRKAAETALKESEEKFREIIQQSADAIILWDEGGDVCEYNSASISLLGITEEEIRSLKGWDAHMRFIPEEAWDPERTSAMRGAFDLVYRTGDAPFMGKVMEFELMRADGSRRTIETVLFPIRTSKGYRIGSISRDVTEARHAKMEARESEERLRSFFDGAFEGVYIIGPDGRIMDCNRRLLELMQLRSDQVIGTYAWDLMYQFLRRDRRSPERLASFKRAIMDSLSNGMTANDIGPISARIMLPDGTLRDVEQGQFSFRSHHGNQIGVVVRDVTERRRAEEVLLQSEENYRTLFESLLDPAVIFDHVTGMIMDCNRNALELLGCRSVDEARAETIWDREGLSREDMLSMLTRTRQEGPFAFEHEMRGEDGKPTWMEIRLRMVGYSGRECALMMARNVSERKRSEEALVNLNRKLSLLGSITRHDILNQLSVLMGYLQLQRDMADRPEGLINLAKMEHSAQTIRQQIEFTGDYEEMGTKVPQWQRLAVILDALPQTKQLSRFKISPAVHRLEIYADPMLRKVFHNLLENSMRHGGAVTRASVDCYVEDDVLKLVYEDDGEGVPGNQKRRIFEKGFGKGTGLGMFLSQEILAITNIGIREDGVPGKGARFEMRVPEGRFRFI